MDIQELAEKLEKDGLEKGKAQADAIIAAAEKQAKETEAAAGKRQDEIIAAAQNQAEKMLESGRQSLRLAARDVLLELQQKVGAILTNLLQRETSAALKKRKNRRKSDPVAGRSLWTAGRTPCRTGGNSDDLGENLQQWCSRNSSSRSKSKNAWRVFVCNSKTEEK